MNTLLTFTALVLAQPVEAVLRFQPTKDNSAHVIARLPADFAAKFPKGRLSQDDGESVLRVSLVDEETKKVGPAMLGAYDRKDHELTFVPRFRLDVGQTYLAEFLHPTKRIIVEYKVPPPPEKSPPKILKIYPTTDVLPANHLKFYIYFDRPMRGGKELFDLIQLVDDKGNVITDAWLLDEIWDEANNCLIIFIHPGRIKWGVELRQQLGPVLYEKRYYSLVVKGTLTDLDGRKLGKDHVKKFKTTPEDRVRIELSTWKLTAPKGEREPVTLTFPKSIDHRSLQRFLTVADANGQRIEGSMKYGPEEKSWLFTPTRAWQKAGHRIDIDGQLEDVAGNTPLLPFDHDLKAPKLPPQKLHIEFQPR